MASPVEEIIADSLAVSRVLAARLPLFNPWDMTSHASQREFTRMVTEKVDAHIEGLVAAEIALFKATVAFWTHPFGSNAMQDMIDAYRAPARATLKANDKRFSKRKA